MNYDDNSWRKSYSYRDTSFIKIMINRKITISYRTIIHVSICNFEESLHPTKKI